MRHKENKPENKILLLIKKIKVLGNNLPTWIISRKRVSIFIIIDILIFILIYYNDIKFYHEVRQDNRSFCSNLLSLCRIE